MQKAIGSLVFAFKIQTLLDLHFSYVPNGRTYFWYFSPKVMVISKKKKNVKSKKNVKQMNVSRGASVLHCKDCPVFEIMNLILSIAERLHS